MRCTKALIPLATGLAMVSLSIESLAAPDEETKEAPRRYRTSKTVIRMEEPRGESKSWVEEHITVRKGVGLVYRYKLETDSDRKIVLSVGGPALKRKRFGLMFEVRF
jgi:hypothetical protein